MTIEKRLNNISCKEYCDIHNMRYSIILKEHSQNIYIPNYRDKPEYTNYINAVKYPEIFISELNNVNIIGANYIIFDENNYCIYDLPLKDDENKFDLKCNNTIYVDKNNTCINYNEPIETIEEGIMLVAACSYNFSHFHTEVLSKLCLINGVDEYNNVPILIDEICLRTPHFLEELQMLNKNGRKIISIKKWCCYNIKKLIYISDLAIYPFQIKEGYLLKNKDCVMDDLCIKPLNENLSIKSNIFRKIFISRRNTFNPRLENQDIVEQIFSENGYEIIFTEAMSFYDKLKIFSEAEFIAGAYGAGFTNVLFANKNAKIICIQPKAIEWPWISNIAGILGQQCYFLDAELSKVTPFRYYQNSFKLDEEFLRKFLKMMK
ncbi:glycosyltransferase family 61 protein [Clostridium saccharoperbutylacetonicum]|uniref:glycosyltransferase family 61 protein n=1 Tax=Clostridium saccharoperbutylacetonicum TaxID=36745 RepID=UPI00156E20D0|nr:glycosyltransferase family 61 protein [Clostridium saccharoperbutylacetonicum]NSB30270.1 capsular polysaccharide biosynthesis protein [Clostridium saccharoperbutylacetonicum]